MSPVITGIDHVAVAVRDLDDARLAWERLGFTLSPRGRHIGRGTANYCAMFERGYIELAGIVDPTAPVGGLAAFLARREGPRGLAFALPSLAAAVAALAARGLHPGAPMDSIRQMELPEGTLMPRFRVAILPSAETPGLSAFLCEHVTPALSRRPDWLTHPNGAIGISSVTVLVAETAPLVSSYERLLGAGSVVATDAVVTAHCGPHRLVFAAQDDLAALIPQATPDPALAPPAIVALTLTSGDLDQTADHLTQWHVPHDELPDGTILVPGREANGATLIFQGG
jgi:hypothetical protein